MIGRVTAALAALALAACDGGASISPAAEAALTETVVNYAPVTESVATSGRPSVEGVDAAKAAGYSVLVDLRSPEEDGVAEAAARAEAAGLRYVSLVMPSEAAEIPAFVDALAPLLDGAEAEPVLLSCASGTRAGAAWALYRARAGVPAATAIAEGRAAGMRSREALVREVLGAPADSE